MLIDLRGKVAIVTGGGRGIGHEIAVTLMEEGVRTVVTDVNPSDLEHMKLEIDNRGFDGYTRRCDVRDAEKISEIVTEVKETYGRIDILVNNAGIATGGLVEGLTEEAWDANLDVNLKGTFLMCRAVIPFMKQQRWGRILNAASFAAIVPSIGGAAYAASKAGVVQFTRVLAGELGPWNITVNCYAPGMVPTDMNHFADLPWKDQQRLLDTLTLRRWQDKKDVARLVCFLASDLAGYITGALIDISGGKLATQIPRMAYEQAMSEGAIESF